MRPQPRFDPADGESDLFRNRLDALIDMRHELVRLAGLIDWKRFDEAFGDLYAEKGRPGLPTRLMVGAAPDQARARTFGRAGLRAVAGERLLPVFQRRDLFPDQAAARPHVDVGVARPHRPGEAGGAASPKRWPRPSEQAQSTPSQMRRVTVDTTAQTKAVAHPTDSHLLLRAIEWLNRLAKKQGLAVRQSYLRVARARPARGRAADARRGAQTGRALGEKDAHLDRPVDARHRAQDRRRARSPGRQRCRARTRQASPGAEARRQEQALRPARARGRMHRQGQGAHALRVRRQGRRSR